MASTTGKLGLFVRSCLQLGLFLLSTGVWGIVSLFTFPFPYRIRYRVITRWSHFNLWVLERVCGIRCEVRGLENIPSQAGVVMSKHQSTWEALALQRWFSPQTWVLKRELMWLPFFGWALALLEPIAINRKARAGAMRQVVKLGTRRLAQGRWLVVFPEGTRVEPGTRTRYQVGGAALAKSLGAHVVPVAHNAGRFWHPHRFIRKPGVVQVRIGPPIDTASRAAKEVLKEVERWIEAEMQTIEAGSAADGGESG